MIEKATEACETMRNEYPDSPYLKKIPKKLNEAPAAPATAKPKAAKDEERRIRKAKDKAETEEEGER